MRRSRETGRRSRRTRAEKSARSSRSRGCRPTRRRPTAMTVTEMTEVLRAAAEAGRQEAAALLEKGEFPAALSAYDRALEAARATDDPAFGDWMYVCRAAAAIEAGPADDVLVELKRVLLRSASPATAVRAAHASARVYELRRDFEKALFYNRIARRHAETLGDETILAHCDNQSGMLLTVDSRFEEAAAVYRRALERTEGQEGVSSIFRSVWRDKRSRRAPRWRSRACCRRWRSSDSR